MSTSIFVAKLAGTMPVLQPDQRRQSMTETSQFGPCSPFLIVSDIERSVRHYVDALGFTCTFRGPEPDDIYFAIVNRGSAQIMLKVINDDIKPIPNHTRHEWAGLDAFIYISDPDTLAREFADRDVPFHRALETDDDGLRGFKVADPDGYVCYFGRPV
ncbi:MAG: VOC family protein [Methyloligellaceae bacterium]